MTTMTLPTTPTLRERAADIYCRMATTIDDILANAPQAERNSVVMPEVDEIEDLLERSRFSFSIDTQSGDWLVEFFDRLDMLVLP